MNDFLTEDLDREVVEAVIIAKEGRVGVCIDICLEMSSGIQTPSEPQAKSPLINPTTKEESEEKRKENTSDLLGLGIGELNLEDESRQNGKPGEQVVDLMD